MSATVEMMPPGFGDPDAEDLRQADFPPVMAIGMVTLVLIVAGGIFIAAQYGRPAKLIVPTILLAIAGVLLVINAVLVLRLNEFPRPVFFRVVGWALLAYAVEAGILAFVFIYDGTPARLLLMFMAMLTLFAIDVPLMLGYSVARWQPPQAK